VHSKKIRKYAALVKSRGGLRVMLRRYGMMQLLDTAIRETWVGCGMRLLRLFGRCPRNGYGWLEAVLFPTSDYWIRYSRVLDALGNFQHEGTLRLLEVSSGRGGLAWLLYDPHLRICLVDRNPEALGDSRGCNCWRVCADAVNLPFSSNSFEVVISVDTVEHLPDHQRETFITELKRVAARAVIITCPLQSRDGEFRAGEFDQRLREEIKSRNRHVPDWLEEHLREGHPTLEQFSRWLPDVQVTGTQNCYAWLRYASLYFRPFGWLLAGLRHKAVFSERDALPPHWRGTLVWHKRDLGSQTTSDPAIAFESETQSSFIRT
jgi:ubiquinone/menaquinone biosynthesis C-methylase UbiE